MKKTIVLFLFIFSIQSFSQKDTSQIVLSKKLNSKSKKDLKVGLVLSGGGAKGFAHIGVLNILDQLGVRVDYIGGTSAGAMIGGLYASGYKAKEIDSIIRSYDFNELIQDKIPRSQLSLYQKEKTDRYVLNLPIKNWKIGLPIALSKGQNIMNELTKLTQHVHNVSDFKKLPIPFYCVATNIETGKKIILENGFLPQAIKASGAFPTLLEPVEIDGEILVDGGIIDNFPVDIMYKKDIDVIIGVDVQDVLGTRENLDSAPKMIMQIISFQMYDHLDDDRDKTDVYLHPNISDYNILSFDKIAGLIDQGERVAMKEKEYLESIAASQIKKQDKPVKKITLVNKQKIYVNNINLKGFSNYTRNYVLSKLNLKGKDSLTYKQFNQCITGLVATKNFKSIDYKFTLLPNNKTTIDFNLTENNISNSLHLGAHYDDLYKTGLLINFTSKHALTNNDIFSVDVILGDNLRYNLDYIVDNGFTWQFGLKSRYNSFKKTYKIENSTDPIFGQRQLYKYNDFTNQVYLLSKYKEKLGLKIGIEHKYLRIFTELGDLEIKSFFDDRNYYGLFGELIFDTYDTKTFTKKGWQFNAKYNLHFGASNFEGASTKSFNQIKANIGYAHTFFDKLTIKTTGNIGLTLGDNTPAFNYFIGGNNQNFINNFIPFYGFDIAAMNDSAFIKAATTLSYEIIKNNFVSFTANSAGVNKNIFIEGSVFDDLRTGYAIGIGNKSIIGPLQLKYAWTPDNNLNYWYFNIGFWF